MNDNVILECSQKSSEYNNIVNNGDYCCVFAEPIFVNDGDSILIDKVFIDTESATDGVVVIDNDITIQLSTYLYLTNNDITKINRFRDGNQTNDNFDYYLNTFTTNVEPVYANMEHITRLRFDLYEGRGGDPNPDYSSGGDPSNRNTPPATDFPVMLKYKDILDNDAFIAVDVPYWDNTPVKDFQEVDVSIFAQKDPTRQQGTSLEVDNSNGNWKNINHLDPSIAQNDDDNGVHIRQRTNFPQDNNIVATPTQFVVAPFVIPKGRYTPQEICNIINDNLDINRPANQFLPLDMMRNNAFLRNSSEFINFDNAPVLEPIQVLISQSEQPPRLIEPQQARFIGTNQVQLSYDEDTEKFFFNFLHMPVYDANGQSIITQVQNVANSNNFFVDSKNGGVAFARMEATQTIKQGTQDEEQIPFDFWNGVLGLDPGMMIPRPTLTQTFATGQEVIHAVRLSSIDGQTTTNAKVTLDSFVQKGDYKKVPDGNANVGGSFVGVDSSTNVVINANHSRLSGELLSSGFFYIAVDCGIMTNKLVSDSESTSTISAVVSRYFSVGSYTTAAADPSFIYTHRGETAILSKAKIRILNSDRTPAVLGDDNTVFLSVVRGEQSRLPTIEEED